MDGWMEDEVVACLPCGIGVRVLRWVMRGRSLGVEEMEMRRVGDGDGAEGLAGWQVGWWVGSEMEMRWVGDGDEARGVGGLAGW